MSCAIAGSDPLALEDKVGLPDAERIALETLVHSHRTLEDVVRWGLSREPPAVVRDVVVQDEYTHDVVLPIAEGRVLVYDTT